jgi:hypothetical protein
MDMIEELIVKLKSARNNNITSDSTSIIISLTYGEKSKLISELTKLTDKWISVEDGLPEDDEGNLFWIYVDKVVTEAYLEFIDDKFAFCVVSPFINGKKEILKATHYIKQYIPQPPKGDKG